MALALMLFQQLSGINAVMFYLQDIFIAAGTDDNPPGISAFLVCLVQVEQSYYTSEGGIGVEWLPTDLEVPGLIPGVG